jgi:hypothetical protein
VLALQGGDPTLGSGAPFDEFDEVVGVLDGLTDAAGLAFSEDGDQVDTEPPEVLVDR